MGENIVRQCYTHETGIPAPTCEWTEHPNAGRAYMKWCEAKANKWRAACDEFGYKQPTFEIRTLSGSITYHEWLKREVGL